MTVHQGAHPNVAEKIAPAEVTSFLVAPHPQPPIVYIIMLPVLGMAFCTFLLSHQY